MVEIDYLAKSYIVLVNACNSQLRQMVKWWKHIAKSIPVDKWLKKTWPAQQKAISYVNG